MKRVRTSSAARRSPLPAESASEPSLDPARLIVTLTVAELMQLVREAAVEAISEPAAPRPALLDRAGLAQALGISTSMVDKLRARGAPVVWLGDSPRFELAPCLEWLRARRRGQP